MGRNFVIKIKKRTQPEWLIWLLIILPFCFGLLNLLRMPWGVRYILDVVWLVLLIMMLRFKRSINIRPTKALMALAVMFFIYTLMVYILRYQSALYYLWGARNNFRFYVAFFAFAAFLTQEDAEEYLKLMDKLFWINVVVSLVQYFGMGLKGDYLGGIFGSEVGVNGYTNIFFVIVLTRSLLRYLEKKENPWVCASKCLAALVVAVLAELKFFFIEALLIIALAVLITDFTWRKLWTVVVGITAIFAGALALAVLFPQFGGWFSVESILSYALSERGYTASGDLNRLTAIPRINELWLRKWPDQLFGLGMGNCETASFAFLNTPFFKNYGHMHYSWMSYAQMYLECGWIGLLFLFGFFVLVFFQANKLRKNSKDTKSGYCSMAMIMAVMCVLIAVYNNSLRMEAGYMAYFVLALPFMKGRDPAISKQSDASQQQGKDV